MAVNVYRSSDSNAPTLSGVAGSLNDVLTACLVNGYGSVFAAGPSMTFGVNPTNLDTVTIGTITYTFKTTLASAKDVKIGTTLAITIGNLADAINGGTGSGTGAGALEYKSGSINPDAWATAITATTITLKARVGGSGGNSIGVSKVCATLTLGGANFAGGSGSDSIASAGWSRPYTANGALQSVFRSASGLRHYYHVDDMMPTALDYGTTAQFRGSEIATGFHAGITGYFPTAAQLAIGSGVWARKSADNMTARSWTVVADERTVWVFVIPGDGNGYNSIGFGELFSIYSGADLYNSFVIGRINAGALNADEVMSIGVTTLQVVTGHYIARPYTGLSGAAPFGKFADVRCNNLGFGESSATMDTPNGPDGKIHISPIHVCETQAGTAVRGRLRGLYALGHSLAAFTDGDTITGSGAYAGRTFLTIVGMAPGGANMMCVDITGAWETN